MAYERHGMYGTPEHTIDRIKNNVGYEPGNCRWATNKEQSINRDRCWITHNGQTKRIRDWATELGITMKTIRQRRLDGLSMDEILSPSKKKRIST